MLAWQHGQHRLHAHHRTLLQAQLRCNTTAIWIHVTCLATSKCYLDRDPTRYPEVQ